MPSCVFRKCRNYTGTTVKGRKTVSFHLFPKKGGLLYKKWVEVVRAQRREDDWMPTTYSTICSQHFVESDKYVTTKNFRKLKKTAIPVTEMLSPAECMNGDIVTSETILEISNENFICGLEDTDGSMTVTNTLAKRTLDEVVDKDVTRLYNDALNSTGLARVAEEKSEKVAGINREFLKMEAQLDEEIKRDVEMEAKISKVFSTSKSYLKFIKKESMEKESEEEILSHEDEDKFDDDLITVKREVEENTVINDSESEGEERVETNSFKKANDQRQINLNGGCLVVNGQPEKSEDVYESSSKEQSDSGDEKDSRLQPNVIRKVLDILQIKDRRKMAMRCHVCSKQFQMRNECKRHMIKHLLVESMMDRQTTNNRLRCYFCPKDFLLALAWKQHMREHSFLRAFKCELCLKSFSNHNNLSKHQKFHSLYSFICNLCGGKFNTQCSLEQHLKKCTKRARSCVNTAKCHS